MKRRAWYVGLLAILAAVTLEAPAFAQSNGWQEIQNGWGEVQTVPGYSVMPAPSGCVSTSVPFFGSTVTLGCDGGLTYDAATDTLTTVDLRFSGTTSVGFVPKTLTTTQRDALSTPPAGSMIYNSTTGRVEVYDGAAWHGRVRLTGDTMSGDLTVTKGTGTATGRVSNVLYVSTTSQATTGTSEQVLATYPMPANTLSADGKAIRIRATLTHAANTNNTTARIRLGGIGGASVISQSNASSGDVLMLEVIIYRTGAATQYANGWSLSNAGGRTVQESSPTATLSNANDIVVTGTTGTSAGDLTFKSLLVEALN